MSGYNLRSRKNNLIKSETSTDNDVVILTNTSVDVMVNTDSNLSDELESLKENNKNLYSKYNNISRSKLRMKNLIQEKDAKIASLESKVKELLEKQNSFCETKDLADDWVSLQ